MSARRCRRAPALAALALALASAALPLPARAASPFDALLQKPAPAAAPATRDFASDDLLRTTRLAIAALQDLGFALESADATTGTIVASRLDTHPLRLTVTVSSPRADTVTAAVTADYAGLPVANPGPAEAFFAALTAQLEPPPAID